MILTENSGGKWGESMHGSVERVGFSVGARIYVALAGEDFFSEKLAVFSFVQNTYKKLTPLQRRYPRCVQDKATENWGAPLYSAS